MSAAVARLDGLGPLDALLHDATVDEVLVNGGGEIWVERAASSNAAARSAPTTSPSSSSGSSRRSGGASTARPRSSTPASATGRGVRRRAADQRRRDDPVAAAVPQPNRCRSTAFGGAAVERRARRARRRALQHGDLGATSSGKTSLLSSLLGLVRGGERIVLLEDTAELAPPADHVVRLEARPASNDGVPAITVEQLLRTALRLRPDRLVVGEVRGAR